MYEHLRVGCPAPPFSGVFGSVRWCGVNVGSRIFRAGFTGTRRVLVSAVPSAGVGGPAPCLEVRGSGDGLVMGVSPTGPVSTAALVSPSGAVSAAAGELPIGQRQRAVAVTAESGQSLLDGYHRSATVSVPLRQVSL